MENSIFNFLNANNFCIWCSEELTTTFIVPQTSLSNLSLDGNNLSIFSRYINYTVDIQTNNIVNCDKALKYFSLYLMKKCLICEYKKNNSLQTSKLLIEFSINPVSSKVLTKEATVRDEDCNAIIVNYTENHTFIYMNSMNLIKINAAVDLSKFNALNFKEKLKTIILLS